MELNPSCSFYFVREAKCQALLVSILEKFISQESFKIASAMPQNNSNNGLEQENQHQNPDNETMRKECGKAGVSPVDPAEKVVGKENDAKPSPK